MPYLTTGSNTELQAVNQILASVGQAPVTTLTTEETLVINEVDRFIGFLGSTFLFTQTNNIPLGTYIGGVGVTTNTSIATAAVVFSPTAEVDSGDTTKLTSSSPYIPKGVLVTSDTITVPLKVTSGPTANGANWDYDITLADGTANTVAYASNTLTLDPIYYQYTTNISQTVNSPDDQKALTQSIVTSRVETQANPDVAIALNTLREVSREVQAEGWSFNKEYDYPITPDSNNEVQIASDVLQMDLNQSYTQNLNRDSVMRGGKLYDRTNHSYKWTDETLYVDIVWEFDWASIPEPIQAFITARAAAVVSSRIIGDSTQYQVLLQKEAVTRSAALEYDCNQGDYTFFGHPKGANYYQSYQPYHTLIR
jgi:hypothetical protein